jgi:integrase
MAERTTERPSAPPVRPASADAASRTAAPAAARTPRPPGGLPEPAEALFPAATARGAAPATGPSGPDPDKARALAKARRRGTEVRRKDPDGEKADGTQHNTSTQADYLARGRMLIARYRRESGVEFADEDIDPRDFVNWLLSLKPTVKPSTWRVYRVSAVAKIQTMPNDGHLEALAMLEDDIGAGAGEARSMQHGRRVGSTSSDKATRIDRDHFDAILSDLRFASRSQAVPWLRDWMIAGINTGLSPAEWSAVDLEIREDRGRTRGRRVWLHVINAKATHGGANGSSRTLDISDFSDEAFEAVQRMVRRATDWALTGEFRPRQSQCAQLFYEICAAKFSRRTIRYSLYTFRHQFIANMKTIYRHAEVAALAGHLTDETATEHYGKRRQAWHPHEIREVPVPIEQEVTRFRKRLEFSEARRKAANSA